MGPIFTVPGILGELQTATREARSRVDPHLATTFAKGGGLMIVRCVPRVSAKTGKPLSTCDVHPVAGPFTLQGAIDYFRGL